MIELITKNHSKSPVAEAYRTIRTNVQFSAVNKALQTIAITSATANEGKSTIVSNLGVVMAQAGHKGIDMDCDFRNPTQHKIFKVPNKGLSNCVSMQNKVVDIIQHTDIEGLDILTSGPVAPNPSEILSSKRMDEVLEVLSKEYDYVIIDTPPILPVTDAAVVAAKVDGIIMITAWGTVSPQVARDAKTRLIQAGANIIGVILNKVEVNAPGNGYGYGYGYGYYYYYGSEEKDEGEKRRHSKEQ
jgi:capsular exopolysaccharide synthesis family protein